MRRFVPIGTAACVTYALLAGSASLVHGAESPPQQVAGVDNTRMGAYRALARLSYEAFGKGDAVRAAELARILERTWDAAEDRDGPTSLGVQNKELFKQIDEAMDAYIKPLIHYATQPPASSAVAKAYQKYLEELKEGDQT